MANFYVHVAPTNPTKAGHARKPLKSLKATNRAKSLKTTKAGDLAISALKTPGWLVFRRPGRCTANKNKSKMNVNAR